MEQIHGLSGRKLAERSTAWLVRLVRDQKTGGSNPLAPTSFGTA